MENLVEISLDEAKEKMLEMMCYIDKVCRDNNIKYSLAYGTLIGAIRHKGFIPWDDDMDIMLTRDNYDKLIEIIKKDDKYDFLDIRNGLLANFSKICYKNTVGIEHTKFMKLPSEVDMGVYIDIFPIDNLPEKDYIKHRKKILFYLKLLNSYSLKRYFCSKSSVRAIIKLFLFLPFCLYSKFFYNKEKIINKINCLQIEFNNSNEDYVGIASFGYFERYKKKWFNEYIDVKFEGYNFMLVKNYDSVIRVCYNDYMTIPSKKNRRIHLSYFKWYKKIPM
ncbi:LicD family protein [Campylobacter hominis]